MRVIEAVVGIDVGTAGTGLVLGLQGEKVGVTGTLIQTSVIDRSSVQMDIYYRAKPTATSPLSANIGVTVMHEELRRTFADPNPQRDSVGVRVTGEYRPWSHFVLAPSVAVTKSRKDVGFQLSMGVRFPF